jgi:hypothetical protein
MTVGEYCRQSNKVNLKYSETKSQFFLASSNTFRYLIGIIVRASKGIFTDFSFDDTHIHTCPLDSRCPRVQVWALH